MLAARGKVASSCTVTRDPTLQYITHTHSAAEHTTELEASLCGLKAHLKLAQAALLGVNCGSVEACEGRI